MFEPPLPASPSLVDIVAEVERTLADGIRSIAPGRVMRWSLGAGRALLSDPGSQVRTVRVTGDGPHGPLPVFEIEIDIAQWRHSPDAPEGSLHHVRGAIQELTKVAKSIDKSIQQASNHDPE
ncbi:hypothetical protein [Gordonia sihwensis]|uniref:hypothetical protein n=1 Tax=Gordonia sihwensis TaxID=173559 RepID=UPI000A8EB373|nr:hypothetical protein [Gordonia sihwensis]